ncbi:MAG TPA: hypothetical protein VD969_10010 [Symbiobacteriaceae bacterium]|nr:hypothetical protein [Symbiobacteriaceae bacterium]
MAGWFPGWPGPVFAHGRSRVPTVSLPRMPGLPLHPGGPDAAASSPLAGLAAYGVPIAHTPAGHSFIQAAGAADGGIMLPPEIPGVPKMPGPPDELVSGGPCGGGLFRPVPHVAPFDPGNQVRTMQNPRPEG